MRRQMPRGFAQNPMHDVKPVITAVERHLRLKAAFARQIRHALRIDVRWIADDEIVTRVTQRREQVTVVERDAILKPVVGNVLRRHFQRVLRQVDGIDPRIGEMPARQNREAARAGAKVEHAFHRAEIVDQRAAVHLVRSGEMRVEQFADERSRHDHSLVDVERQAAHIDLVDEIGRRLAGRDSRLDQVEQLRTLGGRNARGRKHLKLIGMQMQRLANEKRRIRHRIGGAMRERHISRNEAAHRIANEVEQRQQLTARGPDDLRGPRGTNRRSFLCRSTGFFGACLFGKCLFRHQDLVQRAAAASSCAAASTQFIPAALSSRFQNGARVFK